MSHERHAELADFVANVYLKKWRKIRFWGLVVFALLAVVAFILIGVTVSGAEGSEDMGPPAAIFGLLLAITAPFVWYAFKIIKNIDTHKLVVALRSSPPDAVALEKCIVGTNGDSLLSTRMRFVPGVKFRVISSGKKYTVAVGDDALVQEFLSWIPPQPPLTSAGS